MAIATPRPPKTTSGSSQDLVVISSTTRTNSTTKAAIFAISETVLVVAMAVDTALPVMAFSSPMRVRISATAWRRLSSSIVTVNSAAPS